MTSGAQDRPNKIMRNEPPIRGSAVLTSLLLAGATWLAGQTPASPLQMLPQKPSAAVPTLPPTQPTGPSAQPEAAHPAAEVTHLVDVQFTDGKLAIQVTNAGLNEVLREVSHKTGIKVTGRVSDDRVFGSYGPSSPAVVLDALLDGADSNILLVDDAKGGSELILTPRRGGVTPPNASATQASEPDDTGSGAYVPPVVPYQAPVANGRGPGGAPVPQGATATSEEVDGGAPKTPRQIYEQLQKTMQQQRQNSTAPQ